ncbi:MAG: porin [Aureispira sp.]|nr:porin [Aureispira sp.]
MKITICLLLLLFTTSIYAQKDTVKIKQKPKVTFDGAMETYYSYDLNQPTDGDRPSFIYSHSRHNEFNVNLAMVRASVASKWYRGSVGFGAGSFMQYNMSHEPAWLRYIYEAQVGIRIVKGLWLDAGIFPSHLGFESAIGSDNWTLTRSLVTESAPYYLAGAKLTYTTPNDQWSFAGIVCNGWQNIAENNALKAGGLQVVYKPTDKITINYSNYIGDENPDTTEVYLLRFFNNLYGTMEFGEHFKLATGVDFGIEQSLVASDSVFNGNQVTVTKQYAWFSWVAPVVIAQYSFNDKWQIAGRVEYFLDYNAMIMEHERSEIFGYSLNVDFSPVKYTKIRLEGRFMHSIVPVFEYPNNLLSNQNFAITASASVRF